MYRRVRRYSDNINEKWNAKMINRILRNRTYTGHLIQGKKKVESYRNHKLIEKCYFN